MKFILLPPQPAPKRETAHYRPKTLGEMMVAFLNANNPKHWAEDKVYPDAKRLPPGKRFKTHRAFQKALNAQNRLLDSRYRERQKIYLASIPTVPTRFEVWAANWRAERHAAYCLAHSREPLKAADYFTKRVDLLREGSRLELEQFSYSRDIQEFIELLDNPKLIRKHVISTRTDFTQRDLDKP